MGRTRRRIPLNPCDYLYYAHHDLMRRRGQGGNVGVLTLEAEGRADPDRIRSAMAAAMLVHPVTMARLRVSLALGRPYWQVPPQTAGAALRAVERAYLYEDLRGETDWPVRLDRLCQARNLMTWDFDASPQFRLEHYDLPGHRTRFCYRVPHAVMDAQGIQWFFAEMQRLQTAGLSDLACRIGRGSEPSSRIASRNRVEAAVRTESQVQAQVSAACRCRARVPRVAEQDAQPSTAATSDGAGWANLPPGLLPDACARDMLAGMPLLRRIELARKAMAVGRATGDFSFRPLFAPPYPRSATQRYVQRCWQQDQVRQMRENARRWAPPGPFHHARFIAACVFRALHRLYTESGVRSGAYALPFPVSLLAFAQDDESPGGRPILGNNLVSPTLIVEADLVSDRQQLGEELFRQIDRYIEGRVYLGQWSAIWLASLLRTSMYRWLLRLPLGLETLSSGFSYFGTIPHRLRSICGARVTNLWAAAPMAMPPGLNPIFTKYESRLNLALSWSSPAVPDDVGYRYADLMEEEIFAAG